MWSYDRCTTDEGDAPSELYECEKADQRNEDFGLISREGMPRGYPFGLQVWLLPFTLGRLKRAALA